MLVNGLEDRLAVAQVRQVLGDDVEVIAVRMQRRDPVFGSLAAVIAVVIVGADVGDVVLAQDPHQTARDRGLAGGGVADDAEDYGARVHRLSSLNTELCRMSSASIVIRS